MSVKTLSRKQLESRKAQGAKFARDVLDDLIGRTMTNRLRSMPSEYSPDPRDQSLSGKTIVVLQSHQLFEEDLCHRRHAGLLVSQRHHGINLRGSVCGDIARKDGDTNSRCRCQREGQGICRRDAKEQIAQQASER